MVTCFSSIVLKHQLISGTCIIFFRLSLTEAIFLDYMSQAFFFLLLKTCLFIRKKVLRLSLGNNFVRMIILYLPFKFTISVTWILCSFYLAILQKLSIAMSYETTIFSLSSSYFEIKVDLLYFIFFTEI